VTCLCFEWHCTGTIRELNLPGGVPNNQPWIARNSTDSGTSSIRTVRTSVWTRRACNLVAETRTPLPMARGRSSCSRASVAGTDPSAGCHLRRQIRLRRQSASHVGARIDVGPPHRAWPTTNASTSATRSRTNTTDACSGGVPLRKPAGVGACGDGIDKTLSMCVGLPVRGHWFGAAVPEPA
jgi:hypothetical protein